LGRLFPEDFDAPAVPRRLFRLEFIATV
jgi:hypothetical protein